jgi:hypothetical protein
MTVGGTARGLSHAIKQGAMTAGEIAGRLNQVAKQSARADG